MQIRMSTLKKANGGKLSKEFATKSKYRAKRTSCGIHEHASKKEAKVCGDLQLMERGGVIHNLKFQVPFDLFAADIHNKPIKVTFYVADFTYEDLDSLVILDAKGFKTPMYRLKKKMMKICHGVEVQEA